MPSMTLRQSKNPENVSSLPSIALRRLIECVRAFGHPGIRSVFSKAESLAVPNKNANRADGLEEPEGSTLVKKSRFTRPAITIGAGIVLTLAMVQSVFADYIMHFQTGPNSYSSQIDVDEGETQEFDMRFTRSDSDNANVTFTLELKNKDSDDDKLVRLNTKTLSFNTFSWFYERGSEQATARGVSFTAFHDANNTNDCVDIEITNNRNNENRTMTVCNKDDDDFNATGTIDITPAGTLNITEGASQSLSVKLSAPPNHPMTVSIATSSDRLLSVSPASLNFTTSNHSTAQTVTLTADHDDNAYNHPNEKITFTASKEGFDAPDVTRTVSITDDESAGFDIVPASLEINEGGQGTFQVRPKTRPSQNITVSLTPDADISVNPTSLTFNQYGQPDAWNQYKTVTVSARHDPDIDDDSYSVKVSGASGDYDGVSRNVTINVNDDDKASGTIQITPSGTLNIEEGESGGTLSVSLSTVPSADVTISLSNTNSDVTLAPTSLTFTTSNYSTAQTVTVSAREDADAVNETDTITLSASGGIIAPDVTKPVYITDADALSGTMQVTPTGTLSIEEGSTGTLQIKLSATPTRDVIVHLSKTNPDITLSPASLTFTASNYSTAQSVTLSAADDDDTDHESDTITLRASGGIIAPNVTVSVAITDDDAPSSAIEVTPTGTLSVGEGSSGTLSIKLGAAPNANVTISLSKTNSNITLSPASLTFTVSNYSTAQQVTVSAAEDADTDHDSDTITLSASGGIDAPDVAKAVAIVDNDLPSGTIDITPAGTLSVNEGDSGTLSVSLSAAPNADVTVSLSKTNDDVTLSPASLTFTTSNYSTGQAVTLSTAADDDASDDTDIITLTASGGIDAPNATIGVVIADDDTPSGAIEVDPGTLNITEGDSLTFDVSLDTAPKADVTISLSNVNSDVTLDPTSLTFTPSNHSTAQRVSLSVDEDDDTDYESDRITLSASGGIVAPDLKISVNIADNDLPSGQIQVTPVGALRVGENGSNTFDVSLSVAPNADVTISLSKTNNDVVLSPASLTFTPSNYSVSQTLTVSAADDDDRINDTDTITLSASGGIEASEVTRSVNIIDDDSPSGGILINPSTTLDVAEGGSSTFTVVLTTQPSADVTVSLSKTNSDVSLSPNALTFTTSDFATPQTITLSAAPDADATDDTDTITVKASGGIRAPDATISINIEDDDLPSGAIRITPAGTLSVDEGQFGDLNISLSAAPTGSVTVRVSTQNGDIITFTPASLTFTSSDYDVEKTVRVTATENTDDVNGSATLTFEATGGGITIPAVTKAITVIDNDSSTPTPDGTILLDPSGSLTITEGAETTRPINVSLSTQPKGNVTITLSTNNEDLQFDPSSLSFDPSNYSQRQQLTIRSMSDDDSTNDSATLTLEAGGGITAPAATMEITVIDDDAGTAPPSSYTGGIIVTPSGPADISKGERLPLRIRLDTEPTEDVTISLSNENPDLTLSAQSVTFTPSDWRTQAEVDIIAAEYAGASNNTDTIVFSIPGRMLHSFQLAITDRNAGIFYRPQSFEMLEGAVETLFIRLSRAPFEPVVIRLTSRNSLLAFHPTSLTFDPSNWDAEVEVSIFADIDADTSDNSDTIIIDPLGDDFHTATVDIEIKDDKAEPNPDWPAKSKALAIPPTSAQDTASIRVRCKQDTPCKIFLDCSSQVGSILRGHLPDIQAWGTSILDPDSIQRQTGAMGAWRGRLGCSLLSESDISVQVWTRSGDGVLVNNSAAIRSVMAGEVYRADIESIPSPDSSDLSNIRIRCDWQQACTETAFACYTDDGQRYDAELEDIPRMTTRHLQTEKLASMLNHRWSDLGLSCELRSKGRFTVQVLTRTGGGGALVNNSATGE